MNASAKETMTHKLPSHWNIVLFKDIADFKNGLNFKIGEGGHRVKILGVGDFQNHSVSFLMCQFLQIFPCRMACQIMNC